MGVQDNLICSAADGWIPLIERFLSEGAELNGESKDGRTALIAATAQGRSEVVDFLLNQNADVNYKTQRGETALKSSWRKGHLGIAQAFLSAGAQPDAEDIQGLLFLASEKGDLALVEFVVDKGADISARNAQGRTALRTACESRNFKIAHLLLTRGASLEQESKKDLIACAARGGDRHLVQMILGTETPIESVLEMQDIALSAACSGGQRELIRFFLKEFKDITTDTMVTAFKVALSEGHWEVGTVFRDRGLFFSFQMSEPDREEMTVLDYDVTALHGEAWVEYTDKQGTHRLAWCRWTAWEDWSGLQVQEGDDFLLPLIKGGQWCRK
jgi:ankyrin repeat protein